MTQAQLDHAVARATGETVETVRQHGFSPLFLPQVAYGPESGCNQQTSTASTSKLKFAAPIQAVRKAA